MVNQHIIGTLKNYLKAIPANMGVKRAYLFGSYAKGSEHEDSDIDIALILEHMEDKFITQQQLMKLRHNIDLRIGPHPFAQEEFDFHNPFAFEIQQTGIEIPLN
jgi:predicted nucleotidyltransferase